LVEEKVIEQARAFIQKGFVLRVAPGLKIRGDALPESEIIGWPESGAFVETDAARAAAPERLEIVPFPERDYVALQKRANFMMSLAMEV
jgi:hypothetical protein